MTVLDAKENRIIRELSFFSSRGGGGGLVETGGGSSKYNRLKRGDQEKNNVIEGGDQTFLLHRFKKKIEWVRLMMPLELLCISPELTRVTCLVTST